MSPFEDRFKRVNEKWSAINQVSEVNSFSLSGLHPARIRGPCPLGSNSDENLRNEQKPAGVKTNMNSMKLGVVRT